MPDLRPIIEQEQVFALLRQHFSAPITHLVPLEGGQVARAFAFCVDEQEYILRLNDAEHMPISFAKEAYLARTIASPQLPIPAISHVGRWHKLHFAISAKAPGQMVEKLPVQEVVRLIPQLIATLDTIRQVDVSQTQNYGIFDEKGVGLFPDWRSSLARVKEEEEDRDYFGKWHHLFDETFLELDLFDDLFQHMMYLLDFCPNERYLVHGGYSLRNILTQEGKITAVVDWLDAKYGDFVFDIAVLDFWLPGLDMSERCRRYYQARQVAIPFYEKRVRCYQCYTALDASRFFAKKGDRQAYQWTHQRILPLLQRSA
jgi:hygromycin-B 4-O-kinase